MSQSQIVLPATGGGALLAGLIFDRFFLAVGAVLFILTAIGLIGIVKGRREQGRSMAGW